MTMEPIASAIETLVSRYRTSETPLISFDPNIRPLMIHDREAYTIRFEQWVAASSIVKISAEDFEFVYPELQPEEALRNVFSLGPILAVCTLGSDGAMAMLHRNDGKIIKVSAPGIPTKVVDTVGAGDTFHGAILAWLYNRKKLSRCALANLDETELNDVLVFANKAASIVCSRHGGDSPTMQEMV
jgi:fructokinase